MAHQLYNCAQHHHISNFFFFFAKANPIIGQRAPEIEGMALVNGQFKKIKLDDYKGKYLILFFYPMDFTFVCPTEIIAFDNAYEEFKKMNCEIVGISTDSVYCHLAWTQSPRKEGGLGPMKIPLIGDVSHDISKAYNVLITSGENKGVDLRGTFIIDPNGILRISSYNDLPIGRSVAEFKRLLEAIQFHAEHGEVCPANWQKGEKTIKPEPKKSLEYFSNIA